MTQYVSDCLRIMRLALGRRNQNDPDASDGTLLSYLNDFIQLIMRNDLRVFEQFGTLQFEIDETNDTGVYTFNDVGASSQFASLSQEAFITLTEPPEGSISWNRLEIYQDPGVFYDIWGVDNTDILIRGYPTQMLYYGTEMVFRTIPNTSYTVVIYGYKISPAFDVDEENPALPFDWWVRYLAYGAARNYAADYRYEGDTRKNIEETFKRERMYLLTNTHNQIKQQRAFPRF